MAFFWIMFAMSIFTGTSLPWWVWLLAFLAATDND